MPQRATDVSGVMLAAGAASLPIGAAASLVLVLALGSLLRSAGRARRDARTEHHHYAGPVLQENTASTSTTYGLVARTSYDRH